MGSGIRLPRAAVEPAAVEVVDAIRKGLGHAELCGSLRRGRATIGDIDVVVAGDTNGLLDAFPFHMHAREVNLGPCALRRAFDIDVNGIPFPLRVDVWTSTPESHGAMVLHATGSGPFNVIMRRLARACGMTLDMTGVRDMSGRMVAGATEEECFEALGWRYVPPHRRERSSSEVRTRIATVDRLGPITRVTIALRSMLEGSR